MPTVYVRSQGTGSVSDKVQLFAINLAVILLGIVYWQDGTHRGVMPHNADTAIKVATSAGAIFGQCIFGYLGDLLGRKHMYGVELMIIIATTLAQSLCGESSTLSIVGVLIFYRVVSSPSTQCPLQTALTSIRSWASAWEAIIHYLLSSLQSCLALTTVVASLQLFSPCKDSASWPPRS